MRPPNSGRCCVEGRPAHIAACCFHEKHLQARTMPHSHNEPGCMNNLSRLSLSDMKIAQIQQKLSCLAFQYFAKKTNLLILLYHSAIASAWWYLESEIQILEWFACRTCHSTHGWEHWRNRLKTAVKAFCLVLGLFCLSFFPPFLYVYSLSLSLSYKTISKSRADPARLQLSEQAKGPGDVQCAKQSGDGNARTACTTANLQSLQRKKMRTWKDARPTF